MTNKKQEIKVIGNIITNHNPKRIKVYCKYDEDYKIMRIYVKLKKSKIQ